MNNMKLKGLLLSRKIEKNDLKKLKENNIDIVFIKLGYTSYSKSKNIIKDNYIKYNYDFLRKNNYKVGIYFESAATNCCEMKKEADFINKSVEKIRLDYPIMILIIDSHSTLIYSSKNQLKLSKREMEKIVKELDDEISKCGNDFCIASYKSWFDNNLNSKDIYCYNNVIVNDNFDNYDSNLYNEFMDNVVYLCNNENINIVVSRKEKLKNFFQLLEKILKK